MSVNAVNAASMMPMLKLVKAMNKGKASKPVQRQQASAQEQAASRKNAQGREGDILKQLTQLLTNGAQQDTKGSQLRSGLQQGGAPAGGLQNANGAAGQDNLAASESMMESQMMAFIGELKKILGKLKGKGDMGKLGDALSKSDNPMLKALGQKVSQAASATDEADGAEGAKKGGCCGKKDKSEGMGEMSGTAGMNASTGENNLRKAQGNDVSDDPSTDTSSQKLRGATGGEPSGFDPIAGESFEDFLFRAMSQITKDLQKELRDQVKKIKALSAASAAAGAAGGPAAAAAADSKMLAMEKLKQLTQKLQQAFQALSNVMNNLHNGAMNSVRNIK